MFSKLVKNSIKNKHVSGLVRGQASAAAAAVPRSQDAPRETAPKKEPRQNKSFVMNMFCGVANTEQLLPYPNHLTEDHRETLEMLIEPAEKFFAEVNNPAMNDKLEKVEDATLEGMKELGMFGLQVPVEYGGIGCTNTMYGRLVEIVGGSDLGVGIVLGAHQSIGFKGILIAGNDEQKAKYLPKVASCEHMAAFALTEPGSGSDANSITTRAVPSADGSHYILNGGKIWISNGGHAEIFTVFAKTPVVNDKGETKDKVTAFIVERSFGGVTNGNPNKKMGIKCSNTTEVYFDNVPIPAENVLGTVGGGFKIAMEILNNGRFGMAAAMTGCMRTSIQKATDFATNRTQFGAKINSFGSIQEKLARMAMYHYVTESIAFMISNNMDGGSKDYHLEAAISKVFGSEAAWHVTDEAIQVLGGTGFMSETGLEKVMRDLRIFRIFEGTNDILRLLVALSGIQFSGQHLQEVARAMKHPVSNMGLLMDETSKRALRAIGLDQATRIEGAHPSLQQQADDIAQTVSHFGAAVEWLLLKHKKSIIGQQFELNRIANAAIDLYSSGCVLSRASHSLTCEAPTAEHEMRLARCWINEACQRARYNLKVVRSPASSDNFADMKLVSDAMCEQGGIVAGRALGF